MVTLSGEAIKALPTVRSYNALVGLVPGVVTSVNDVVTGTAATSFPIHGGRTNESRLLLDGLTVGSPPSGNSATSYVFDTGTAEEMTFAAAGGLGEAETAGLVDEHRAEERWQRAPTGSLFAGGTGAKLQSDNLTDDLRRAGVAAATPLSKVYDFSGTVGGPVRKDRAWFFVNRPHRWQHSRERQRVLQPECRRSGQPGCMRRTDAARVLRSHVRERQCAPDLANDAAPHDQRRSGTHRPCAAAAQARRPA